MTRIQLGAVAGHHFWGQGDLQVARHARCGKRHGYLMSRKRLVDRESFERDPTQGWEVDRWFEWVPEIPPLTPPRAGGEE